MPRRTWRWLAPLAAAGACAVALVLALIGAAAEPTRNPIRAAAPPAAAAAPSAAGRREARRAAGRREARRAAERREARRAAEAQQARRRRAAARRERAKLVRTAQRATRAARRQIGAPYAWGASGPGGFDCSGLTRWALARAGVQLPHDSLAQARTGRQVRRDRVRAGDLVFFSTAGPGPSHVGIAVSASTVVSATSAGVRAHAISDAYWGAHYVGARRVLSA